MDEENKTQGETSCPSDIREEAYKFKIKYLPTIIDFRLAAIEYRLEMKRGSDKRKKAI